MKCQIFGSLNLGSTNKAGVGGVAGILEISKAFHLDLWKL